MTHILLAVATLVLGALAMTFLNSGPSASEGDSNSPQRMLAHNVFFALRDASPQAKQKLVAECRKFLAEHPGTVWFAAGTIVAEHQRDVNDRNFDVALHIVFKSAADHDRYQNAKSHHTFIERNQDNWKSVRVFDSWLDVTVRSNEG